MMELKPHDLISGEIQCPHCDSKIILIPPKADVVANTLFGLTARQIALFRMAVRTQGLRFEDMPDSTEDVVGWLGRWMCNDHGEDS